MGAENSLLMIKFLPLRKSNLQTTMVHDKKIPPPNGPLSALPVLAAGAENSLLMIKFLPLRKSNLQTTMVQDKKNSPLQMDPYLLS